MGQKWKWSLTVYFRHDLESDGLKRYPSQQQTALVFLPSKGRRSMISLVTIPDTIRTGLARYREVFCRDEGFDHISRYVTGWLLSPNKTLQGIYDLQVWGQEPSPSRRAMPAAVFEAGWHTEALMPRHRAVIAGESRTRGVRCSVWIGPMPITIEGRRSGACHGPGTMWSTGWRIIKRS
jgi:hypothetical protein